MGNDPTKVFDSMSSDDGGEMKGVKIKHVAKDAQMMLTKISYFSFTQNSYLLRDVKDLFELKNDRNIVLFLKGPGGQFAKDAKVTYAGDYTLQKHLENHPQLELEVALCDMVICEPPETVQICGLDNDDVLVADIPTKIVIADFVKLVCEKKGESYDSKKHRLTVFSHDGKIERTLLDGDYTLSDFFCGLLLTAGKTKTNDERFGEGCEYVRVRLDSSDQEKKEETEES